VDEFEDLRGRLRQVRTALEASTASGRAVEQRLKRIDAEEAELARVFDPQNPAHVAARQRLQEQRRVAALELKVAQLEREAAVRDEAMLRGEFARFSDPRFELPRLNDATPILLMPVRVETRYQTVFIPGPIPGIHQLLVRIYPDDCWIDAFDATLSESEAASARAYWIAMWQAGGIESQERAAWRSVVHAHGPGRAAWIVAAHKPANLAGKPSKPQPGDVVLTIVSEYPFASAEASAISAFWRAAWLAEGDAARLMAAHSLLVSAVGESRASEIVNTLRPENFDDSAAAVGRRDQIGVSVAQLVLAPIEDTRDGWSTAPRVTTLPDRFVVICQRVDETPLVALGRPVPSTIFTGPDPAAAPEAQLRLDAAGDLVLPDGIAWIADYGKAVENGMAVTIDISPAQRQAGFDRVVVLGVRMSADERTAQAELETLLRHHTFSRSGLSLLPQGTPTNNTDAVSSVAGRTDRADGSFDDHRAPLFIPTSKWFEKKDGQWLAEALGVDPGIFAHVHHADGVDQSCERAMNMALWPATLGYWMASLMTPVFSPAGIDLTRRFFTRYVLGCGAVPALRIGSQPYGIQPAAPMSRLKWFAQVAADGTGAPLGEHAARLYPVLQALEREWRSLVDHVSFVGKPGADAQQMLLDVLGLHSGSVEWSSRFAEGSATLFNRLSLQGVGNAMAQMVNASQWVNAREQLTRLGYQGSAAPYVLDLLFAGTQNLLKGPVIDDRPLSEIDGVRACTATGANYLQWLIDAASTSLEQLYAQDGFTDDTAPTALLYLLLRHALQLGYHDTSVRLYQQFGLLTAEQATAARVDQPILHVSAAARASESRYEPLFAVQPAIAGTASPSTVAEVIASRMHDFPAASQLTEQIAALERLKRQPTARLERAFADHVDCCSYRLDAWTLGLLNYQLAAMRGAREGDRDAARQGIFLGAYGWVEDVRPKEPPFSEPTPVVLDDSLAADFATQGDAPLQTAPGNQGFIHAPSLNQAVAAAVLRNGYISTATPATRDTLAVNLTSERIRIAMWLLEGVRAGQGLSDLLGYQFERGLHDRHGLAEVDKFIYPLRKTFPLRADHMQATATTDGVPIEAIEARNVIDGLEFAKHLKTGMHHYPFEMPGLPPATQAEATAIDREAERLMASLDAVADLALAEGVYQAVLGNYDRATANYDAYARAALPPQPDIVRTPFSAVGLTHRVALHLAPGTDPNHSPEPSLPMTPRAQAEPGLNAWLAAQLPPLSTIGCVVAYAGRREPVEREVTLDRLGLQPVDLVALAGGAPDALGELDERLQDHTASRLGARPDVLVTLKYMEKKTAAISVFEVLPLLRALKRLVSGARSLQPSDLAPANEARSAHDATPIVDRARASAVHQAMQALAGDFAVWIERVEEARADHAAGHSNVLTSVDALADELSTLIARAALFGVPQSGREFIRGFRRRVFEAALGQAYDRATRWTAQLAQFDARIAEHDALPASAADADRFRILAAAESAIRAHPVLPRPSTPAAWRAQLAGPARASFVAHRDRFAALSRTARTRVADLIGDLGALLPIGELDAVPFPLDTHTREGVHFVEEARGIAAALKAAIERRVAEAGTHLAAHDASGIAIDRARAAEAAVKALLGEDFVVIPEFSLPAERRDELQRAIAASRSGAPFDHLVNPAGDHTPINFPVDTWLHGLARVRERLHAWEQLTLLAAAVGQREPALDALQLPHIPGDRWLGLDFAPDQKLDIDRLLYTAHFAAPLDASGLVCGLLLDEWTETIPAVDVDTGIAFHFDRPNAEAPQAMLLALPSEFRGAWHWEDLVDAVNETLDAAKRRAVEPTHIDRLPLAPYLPATMMTTQAGELTIAANLALNNSGVRSGE
jgi:hypothetical protein